MEDFWDYSSAAAKNLGLEESELSDLREFGILKPGIHWKSSPSGQIKPWKPEPLYNINLVKILLENEFLINNSEESAA